MTQQKETLIEFKNVTKRFVIKSDRQLRPYILGKKEKDIFVYGARNLNFSVKRGEIIGLYGPNGSGKSTILRLAAGILKPDIGNVVVRGSIAPVIELGAGLHYELTGRENIDLYGTILGIPSSKISKNKSKIISFAGIEKFLDIPIKFYSSGMKARLAFSIALFSDADIILSDEVFAVGDTSFRDKSVRVLNQMKNSRSILLTSHSLSLMQQVCDGIIILDNGVIVNEQNEALIKFIDQMPEGNEFIVEATSNSMYPLIKSGDYITAKKIEFNNIKVDDIILFHLPNLPEIIVHRVVDIINENKERICITKGDSIFGLDAWKIHKSNYLGKVIQVGEKSI